MTVHSIGSAGSGASFPAMTQNSADACPIKLSNFHHIGRARTSRVVLKTRYFQHHHMQRCTRHTVDGPEQCLSDEQLSTVWVRT